MATKVAKLAVKKILADLTDRRGLRQEWDQLDTEIRAEIRKEWEALVDAAFSELMKI
jgi:hypothetical protein